jgi:hypothetical protein
MSKYTNCLRLSSYYKVSPKNKIANIIGRMFSTSVFRILIERDRPDYSNFLNNYQLKQLD